jgi:hypothetical protein
MTIPTGFMEPVKLTRAGSLSIGQKTYLLPTSTSLLKMATSLTKLGNSETKICFRDACTRTCRCLCLNGNLLTTTNLQSGRNSNFFLTGNGTRKCLNSELSTLWLSLAIHSKHLTQTSSTARISQPLLVRFRPQLPSKRQKEASV